MKKTIEQIVEADRFKMAALVDAVWPLVEAHPVASASLARIRSALGVPRLRQLSCALLRHVFLIELVKLPAVETTKFRVRWFEQLHDDPRECSFDECVVILHDLLQELPDWLAVAAHADLLSLFFDHSILPYEAPLDYLERPAEGTGLRIHRRSNLAWVYDDVMLRTLKLRRFLTDPSSSPDAAFFRKVLEDKIKVKTYLTDRVLTGLHKTNREKRWEAHPQSVHFATRRTAMAIEYTLITQLCAFDGFPQASIEALQTEGVLPRQLNTFRCPVTQEPMSFPLFREELMNPTHGKAEFQVGHLNPLKFDAPIGESAGHTADNISWVSADGNRIQGSMSLAAVRALLRKIATNYEQLGWV